MGSEPIQNDAPIPLFESLTAEDWEREFHAWIDGHDRTTLVPTAESLRREALYQNEPVSRGKRP